MNYKYISLPIELASDSLLATIPHNRSVLTKAVCYIVHKDITGLTTWLSSEKAEYICSSEEEFFRMIEQQKLLNIL